jgi:hypothetical protein
MTPNADASRFTSFVQLNEEDSEGPYDRNNDPFNKYRTEEEPQAKYNGPALLQLSEEGPYDRNNNPFEQYRNPPPKGKQPMTFAEALNWKFRTFVPPQASL